MTTETGDTCVWRLDAQTERRTWRTLETYCDLHDAQTALAALALVGVRCAIRAAPPEAARRSA